VSDGYEILSLDDLDRVASTDGTLVMRPLRRRLGFQPFGVNAWEGEHAGDQVIVPHRETGGPEELYVVVRGEARFTVGDDTVDAPVGTLVHVPPEVYRAATAAQDGTMVLALGAKPGEAFAPSGWEDFYVAFSLLQAGRPAEARAAMQEALEREPGAWQGAYNAACFEALAGETEAAFENLRRAVELDRRAVREIAAGDDDLASLRGDPRFAEVLA
jgi:tetratricopeptide (TPR) repeat protein